MHLANYLGLVHRSETNLAAAFRQVADAHADEPDVLVLCRKLATQSENHAANLKPFADRYGEEQQNEPDRLHSDLFKGNANRRDWLCCVTYMISI